MEDITYLAHFGIKGQRWGVRRYQNEDGSLTPAGEKRYRKEAAKDAKEYARAKMYYGEGAGNRRKLIKATVAERSKDPNYKRMFDEELSKQDMSEHASKAKAERHVNDVKNETGKIGRGVVNIVAGNPQRAAASVLAVYGILHFTGLDKKIVSKGAEFIQNQKFRVTKRTTVDEVEEMLKDLKPQRISKDGEVEIDPDRVSKLNDIVDLINKLQ